MMKKHTNYFHTKVPPYGSKDHVHVNILCAQENTNDLHEEI